MIELLPIAFVFVVVVLVLIVLRKRKKHADRGAFGLSPVSRKKDMKNITLEVKKEVFRLRTRRKRKKRPINIGLLANDRKRRRK